MNYSKRDNSCLIRDSHFYSISFRAFFFSLFDNHFVAPKVVLLHHAACITLCKVLLPSLDPKTTYFWRVDTKSGLIIAWRLFCLLMNARYCYWMLCNLSCYQIIKSVQIIATKRPSLRWSCLQRGGLELHYYECNELREFRKKNIIFSGPRLKVKIFFC